MAEHDEEQVASDSGSATAQAGSAQPPQSPGSAQATMAALGRMLDQLRKRAYQLHKQERVVEAIAVYENYLQIAPYDADTWYYLGSALRSERKYQAAALCHRRALEISPGEPRYLGNLGNALVDLDDLEGAIAAQKAAIAGQPNEALHWINLGLCYRESARWADAIETFEKALTLQPKKPLFALATYERSEALLRLGRYSEAWPGFAERWDLPNMDAEPSYPEKAWRGEDLAGKTIVLGPEQGLGDRVLAARMFPLVKALGATVKLQSDPALYRLFQGLPGVDQLLAHDEDLGDFDYYCHVMSLFGLLDITPDKIPPPAQLAVPEPQNVKAVAKLAPAGKRFKVGIVWRGSERANPKRGAPLECFLELAEVPGVQLYSLYKGERERELSGVGLGPLVINVGGQDKDLADTAAVISQLDLVIMTDTAQAHIAGSLGRPIWCLLSFAPFWVYGSSGEATPWYPSMRLIRQSKPGDWASVFAQVKTDLAEAVEAKTVGRWPPPAGA